MTPPYAHVICNYDAAEIRLNGDLVDYGMDLGYELAPVRVRVAQPKRALPPAAPLVRRQCWPATLDAWRGDR